MYTPHPPKSSLLDAAPQRQGWLLPVLTLINLLNYIDRYIVAALLPLIQHDLQLSDAQGGLVGSAFIVTYFLICPLFGWLGDHRQRPRWLALGVALWSLATMASGAARGMFSLSLARASVGIGEAAYGAIAPSLLVDDFPPRQHGRILATFYMATPVGAALGYVLGGLLGGQLGWRFALYGVGAPGLLLALLLGVALREVPRAALADVALAPPRWWQVYVILARCRIYVMTVAGYTAYTFATGGLAFWMPSYMIRVRHYSSGQGLMLFGILTMCTGVLGTWCGGWLGDRLLRWRRQGYTWLNIGAVLGSALFCFACLKARSNGSFLCFLLLAQLCMFLCTGPINALILNSVPRAHRATAMATSVFCIHLLGDAISPTLIGLLADTTSLRQGVLMIPAFYLLAALLWSGSLTQDAPPRA